MITLQAWLGGILGGALVVGYLAFLAVVSFRKAQAAFADILAEIDDVPATNPGRAA